MTSSLSNLVNNLAEGIDKSKCKDCNCFLEYEIFNENLIKCKCLSCNKNYSNRIDEKFKKWLKKTLTFSNVIDKFILLMRKAVYPYEYMDDRKKFYQTLFPKKEYFNSNLDMEVVKDSDYNHAKRVCKDFEIKSLGKYYDFYLKNWLMFWKTFEKCV